MKLLLALCAVWNIIQLSEGCSSGEMTDRLTCVSDYWFTITCTLSITDEPAGVNYTHYWLYFTWSDEDGITFKCPLVEMVDSYGCTFVAHFDNNLMYHGSSFNTMDCFHVHLCYNIDCQINYDNLTDFEPSKNIQPTAPSHLAVQWTPEGYRCTWQSGYEHHAYMTDFHYQLSFYKYHGDKGEVFHVSSRNNSLLIDGSGLEPDTTYVLKVRSDPNSSEYKGQWSPWSALVQLRTDAKEAEPTIVLVLSQFVFPVCVIAGVLLFVFYNPTTRMKIKAFYDVPSPAPFFQPLYKDYNESFQDWLASECNLIQTCKTQEFLTIDTLIIEAKPIAEDQDCSTTTPYPLAQGQTPYVGPSVMDWVCSHSPNGNGPGDIPYTQLPCSRELQFGDVVTSFSQDPSVTCEGDSGCEDLTLSRDSSLPNSPVSSEPECICTDYCILHETSKGFIPTVVPKEVFTHPLKSYCIEGPGKEETCATE
ncbi:interleukin-21 receptor-like [Coregonus clupeaformis]|uniref:interleukin-21 receptor-like n=1 Tax=Coregonus clupeaformis TaxID=59861 RepID=UPI001BE07F7F|nr:interleukin-21 receptor-like [Coregonus clupeaformis]